MLISDFEETKLSAKLTHLMVTSNLAKFPEPLNLEDRTHRGENWKHFKRGWSYNKVAAKTHKEEEGKVTVAHLLNAIIKDA